MKRLLVVSLLVLFTSTAWAWQYESTTDLMTGVVSNVAGLDAVASQGTLRTPVIILRYSDDLEVFVHWGGYTVDRDIRNAAVRVGDGEMFPWRVILSTTREASFFSDPREFVRLLDGQVAMLVSSSTGRDMIGVWEVKDIAEVLHRLMDK